MSVATDNIDLQNGFTSKLGNKIFSAPTNWKSSEVSFKHKSEHSVDDRKFDLEL